MMKSCVVLSTKFTKKKKVIYLKSLVTAENHRCQGYASKLICHLVENVAGSREILFFCDPNRVEFYKRRGAVTLPRKKFRKVLPEYWMPQQCKTMKFPKTKPTVSVEPTTTSPVPTA